MKKLNLLKTLIILTTVLFGTAQAFASTTAVQTLSVSAQDAVTIEKQLGGTESNTVNPETGIHSGLFASFDIQVNEAVTNKIIIVGSKIVAAGGTEVSAFSDDGLYLLFGRFEDEENFPTINAINDAKNGGSNNPNVIAYPITKMNITSPMTIQYNAAQETDQATVGCYVINLNGGSEATLKQEIDGNPVPGTYHSGQDMSGTYKSTVFLSVITP